MKDKVNNFYLHVEGKAYSKFSTLAVNIEFKEHNPYDLLLDSYGAAILRGCQSF
jgi:hypothetical protein